MEDHPAQWRSAELLACSMHRVCQSDRGGAPAEDKWKSAAHHRYSWVIHLDAAQSVH